MTTMINREERSPLDKLVQLSLNNGLIVLVAVILVIAAGFRAYKSLPIDAFPDVSPNLVQVFTVTAGLAPEEVELYVTYPVEVSMAGLPGLEKVRSISNFGLSVVNIYFEDNVDIYFARQLVAERLQEAREQIPSGFGDPQMGPISTGMGLILFYYLHDESGSRSLEEMRTIQDWIVKFNLQTVPGVTEVLGIGGFEKQFQVNVKPETLVRYDVALGEIVERLEANNLTVGAQYIEKHGEQFVIRSEGLARTVQDIEQVVIKSSQGRPVYIRDVATVEIGGAIRRGLQTRGGEGEVVAGMVIKLIGTNASTVIRQVEERIAELNQSLPEGISIVPYYQQKDLVESAVKTVSQALLQGILLVILVIVVFMRAIRPSLVVAGVLPFAVLFSFLAMVPLGLSANLMTLGGLAIALGMLVDGAIVVVENIDRKLSEKSSVTDAAQIVYSACSEVIRPITFAIVIIVVVFLPLFTLGGVEGKTFKPLAYTIALAMLGALLYTIFVTPRFSALMLARSDASSRKSTNSGILQRCYKPIVEYFVQKPIVAVGLALALLVGGMVVYPKLGAEFTPRLAEGTIVVRLTMAPSISLTESKRQTLVVESRLLKIPEIIEVTSRVGRGEVGAHSDPINSSEMYVILSPKDSWRMPRDQSFIESEIRKALDGIPGIQANLTQPIEMTVDELLEGVRGELAIKIYGDDLDRLKVSADTIAEVIRSVEGAEDVQVDQVAGTPQIVIKPSREAVARYGLNLLDVQHAIEIAIGGAGAGQIFEGTRRFDIYVRYVEHERDNLNAISDLLIRAPNGLTIPLAQLATVEEIVGPRQITREGGQRFITVQCNVIGRDIVSFVAEAKKEIAEKIELPPGYLTSWGGKFRLQEEANKRLAVVVPITLGAVMVLLYLNFGSLGNMLLIVLNIPLALVGGVVALYVSGQNLSVPASVGFIALFGIALGNGMVLISYLDRLVGEGMAIRDAAIAAATARLRPVLMTALTTALGLVPLLLATGTGSEVQKPLATVVVGGLVSSTVLTLLVVPACYRYVSRKNGKT